MMLGSPEGIPRTSALTTENEFEQSTRVLGCPHFVPIYVVAGQQQISKFHTQRGKLVFILD
jgi:hypothetical protein